MASSGSRWRCIAAATSLLIGCTERHPSETLAEVRLSAEQTEGLRRMNEAGTTAFGGYTWRYDFGARCTLRVHRSFEGRVDKPHDYPMSGRVVEVVTYARNGFGVKAYGATKGDSLDLFDTAANGDAIAFAHFANDLIRPCATAR